MAVLADLERLLERVFERSTARLFRAHPQAVQVERRVERAMDRARVTLGGRTTVPARYRVRLNPIDLAEVADASGGPDALAHRLADAALAFARAHGYHLPARPTVALVRDPSVLVGVIEVDVVLAAGRWDMAAEPSPAAEHAPDATVAPSGVNDREPAREPVREPVLASSSGGIRGDDSGTVAFRRPAPAPTRAVLRLAPRNGVERVVEVDGTPLTLGRASDNGLVLADPRVSRHHARLQARRGTLVLTDLGSTNGSRVNGIRVDECVLGAGDRVVLGDTVLLVEQLPG
jgi:bifunctional DNA-binding transcriptional regulator/antitoxin component of YhaV-PrlF toxin-antitoxin module